MTCISFQAVLAAEALQKADLLSGVMMAENGQLRSVELEQISRLTGGFLGAGLDSRHLQANELFVALIGENLDGRKFIPPVLAQGNWVLAAPSDTLLNSFGTPSGFPGECGILFSDNPEAALSLLASIWRNLHSLEVIGVTGTNGKTTTKDLLAAMLRAKGATLSTAGNLNNHLGVPLTLLSIRAEHEFAVIEMGASALGEIDYLSKLAAPQLGIITNASEAHLAEFGSLEGIIQGKGEMLDHLPETGLAILNADSPGFDQWKDRAACQVVSFGQEVGDHHWSFEPSSTSFAEVVLEGEKFPVPLPGKHNATNLVAAILAARELGLKDVEIKTGIIAFRGSPHRGVLLTMGGRHILDDCYNANPISMVAAVNTILQQGSSKQAVAVLGHMAELGENSAAIHRTLGMNLADLGLKNLVVVGDEARPLLDGFDQSGLRGHYCSSLEIAADHVAEKTSQGDYILIKGSRSAAMERILPLLEKKLELK